LGGAGCPFGLLCPCLSKVSWVRVEGWHTWRISHTHPPPRSSPVWLPGGRTEGWPARTGQHAEPHRLQVALQLPQRGRDRERVAVPVGTIQLLPDGVGRGVGHFLNCLVRSLFNLAPLPWVVHVDFHLHLLLLWCCILLYPHTPTHLFTTPPPICVPGRANPAGALTRGILNPRSFYREFRLRGKGPAAELDSADLDSAVPS